MTPALVTEPPSQQPQENVLRAIAHEIRQPLSAIESIAYYVSLTLPDDDKHREQLVRVRRSVEQSNWILSNGVVLADPRRPSPEILDLEELITHALAAKPSSLDQPVKCDLASERPLVNLDPGFGKALIENILSLFRQLATEAHPARLHSSTLANGVELEVLTSAPGYDSIGSLPPGSALSLDCARHIASLHGGTCSHAIDPVSGIGLRVMLP